MAKAEVEPVGDPLDAKVAAAEPATAAIDAVPATTNGARTASKERVPTRRERRRVRGPKLRPSYERQYRQRRETPEDLPPVADHSEARNASSAARSSGVIRTTRCFAASASPPCQRTASSKLRARPSWRNRV